MTRPWAHPGHVVAVVALAVAALLPGEAPESPEARARRLARSIVTGPNGEQLGRFMRLPLTDQIAVWHVLTDVRPAT